MAERDVADTAFERVWRVYRLINLHVDENDGRRAVLSRFLRQRREAGLVDVELLAVEGLKFLKQWDQSAQG